VLRQVAGDEFAVGELGDLSAAVDKDNLLVALVRLRVLDDRKEGREARAGAEKIERAPGREIVVDQPCPRASD